MKEDYLWDKSGNDAEIEKLENALQAFRYKEAAVPALPAEVVSFPARRRRRVFRFTLAAAACVAFGVISFGVWFQISKNNMEVKADVAEVNISQSPAASPTDVTINTSPLPDPKPDDSAAQKIEKPERPVKRNIVKIRKPAPAPVRQKEVKTYAAQQTKSAVFLTEEEKFAYNQLMLALSITGSKLKIVKDKIEGMEEKTAALENMR